MSATAFQDLAAQFCALIDVAVPQLGPDDDGVVAFTATVQGVDVTVTHDPVERPDEASISVLFGLVPDDREVHVLRELLNANPGDSPVMLTLIGPDKETDLRLGDDFRCDARNGLFAELRILFGAECIA